MNTFQYFLCHKTITQKKKYYFWDLEFMLSLDQFSLYVYYERPLKVRSPTLTLEHNKATEKWGTSEGYYDSGPTPTHQLLTKYYVWKYRPIPLKDGRNWLYWLKGQKILKANYGVLNSSKKKEENKTKNEPEEAEDLSIFFLFFLRIKDNINCFWSFLTLAVGSKTAPRIWLFFKIAILFTIIFMSKSLKSASPHFSCIIFVLQLVCLPCYHRLQSGRKSMRLSNYSCKFNAKHLCKVFQNFSTNIQL